MKTHVAAAIGTQLKMAKNLPDSWNAGISRGEIRDRLDITRSFHIKPLKEPCHIPVAVLGESPAFFGVHSVLDLNQLYFELPVCGIFFRI